MIRTIGKVDDGNLSADIVHKARKVLKAKANHYRSLENNEEADLEVPESRQESDGLDYSMSKLSPHEECDNDDQEDEEGEEEENEQQFSSNIIPPSQMVRGVSSEQSNLQRRRSELLQGHQLGGLGAVTQKIEDRTSPTKLIKQIAGTRSSGSFPVWVDLMVAAQGPDVTQLKKVETKKERVVSPETLERRKSMQLFRKVEKMDWRTMLRDESATKLLRPKSASAINTQRPNSASRSRR